MFYIGITLLSLISVVSIGYYSYSKSKEIEAEEKKKEESRRQLVEAKRFAETVVNYFDLMSLRLQNCRNYKEAENISEAYQHYIRLKSKSKFFKYLTPEFLSELSTSMKTMDQYVDALKQRNNE